MKTDRRKFFAALGLGPIFARFLGPISVPNQVIASLDITTLGDIPLEQRSYDALIEAWSKGLEAEVSRATHLSKLFIETRD